jgi:hypothetical protein
VVWGGEHAGGYAGCHCPDLAGRRKKMVSAGVTSEVEA